MSLLKNDIKKKINVIILCAGEGTRLKRITKTIPKPLIKIESVTNNTILNHIINGLTNLEINQIAIVIGYLGDIIRKYISLLIKNNSSLQDKLIIVNAENQYKLGPLYSFLSITKNKSFFKPNNYYILIPGDTIFDINILKEILFIISNNYQLVHEHPFVFYRNIELSTPTRIFRRKRLISNAKVENFGAGIILHKISQVQLKNILSKDVIHQIVPIFILSYNFINKILNLKSEIPVNTVWETLNYMITNKNKIFAFEIENKYYFYDIDNKSDLINLKKKRGQ
ncbi:MAG: sugar phosphate nucleotidyltransferase [Candidatus Hodarchaeota archaeon]